MANKTRRQFIREFKLQVIRGIEAGTTMAQAALEETVRVLERQTPPDEPPADTSTDQVALDSTGLFLGQTSRYFAWRKSQTQGAAQAARLAPVERCPVDRSAVAPGPTGAAWPLRRL